MRMPFQIDLIGKVVLITGVSSGIGLGTAHEFARAGACVAGCARKPESDDSVSAFLQARILCRCVPALMGMRWYWDLRGIGKAGARGDSHFRAAGYCCFQCRNECI